MGKWDYYIVKMKMKDLALEVELASAVHDDQTLDTAIQRTIDESRAKKDLIIYLRDRPDRFFNSLVVAALGGTPTFLPARIADDPAFQLLKSMKIGALATVSPVTARVWPGIHASQVMPYGRWTMVTSSRSEKFFPDTPMDVSIRTRKFA